MYNAQVHRSTNASPFSLVLSHHPFGHTAFVNPIPLPTDASEITFPHPLNARLLHFVANMRQVVDMQGKSSQRHYRVHHDRKVLNVPLLFTARQHIYLDQPPGTRPATEHMATDLRNKLMTPNTEPAKEIKVSLMTCRSLTMALRIPSQSSYTGAIAKIRSAITRIHSRWASP